MTVWFVKPLLQLTGPMFVSDHISVSCKKEKKKRKKETGTNINRV